MAPDLIVLGNLIMDDIVRDDGSLRMQQPGGAVLYMGLAAGLWDLSIGLVSRAGIDFPDAMLGALARRGADISGIRPLERLGLRTWLLYESDVRRVVHRLDGLSHLAASPTVDDLPADWRPRAIHLAPMPFDHQQALARELRRRFGPDLLLSADLFEPLERDRLERWHPLIGSIDLLFLSEDEMPTAGTDEDVDAVFARLLTDRRATLFFKQGRRGGVAVDEQGRRTLRWQPRSTRIVDATGAGDAFACGVLAGLLAGVPLADALARGVVAASFAIESEGVEALLDATPGDARHRLESWFGS